jgi:hypothetical protein
VVIEMKKIIIFILLILVFIASMGVGYFYLNTRNDQKKSSKIDNSILNNNVKNEYIATESRKEKVSPNAKLITTICYKKCGHTESETKSVPNDIVNMTEDEIKEKYKDWEINYFTNKEISLYKEVEENCLEYYKIGVENGLIIIYRLNIEGEEEVYETTNIYYEYLPEKDQEELKNKIEVFGKENLNAVLENFY